MLHVKWYSLEEWLVRQTAEGCPLTFPLTSDSVLTSDSSPVLLPRRLTSHRRVPVAAPTPEEMMNSRSAALSVPR